MGFLSLRLVATLVVLAGCGESGHRLIVQVRTDLVPGVEFVTVRAALTEPPASNVIPAVVGQDFVTAVRLIEVENLATGAYELVVTAADASGRAVVRRTVRVDLREDLAITIALTRSCQDVECPRPSDAPDATTCAAGRCVVPECSEATPEVCAPGDCTMDAQCSGTSTCAVGLCVEGGCFCTDTIVPMDGGVMDGGVTDGGTDAGPPDAGPTCATEVLLADSAPQRTTGSFGATVSRVVIVLTADTASGFQIGEGDLLATGYSGVRDFRASDDSQFARVAAGISGGSLARMALTIPSAGGAFTVVTFSAPLDGELITMVRRNVTSLTFGPGGVGTMYDATVAWELWGCSPGD